MGKPEDWMAASVGAVAGVPARHPALPGKGMEMQASVGDRLHVHANAVGTPDRIGEIVEVKGQSGGPPYLVRFPDGHTALIFPGPDAVIEPVAKR